MALLPLIVTTIVIKILIRGLHWFNGSLLVVQMLHDHDLNTFKDVAYHLHNLKDVAPTGLDEAAHGSPQQLLSAAKTSSVVKIDRQ